MMKTHTLIAPKFSLLLFMYLLDKIFITKILTCTITQ